MIESRVGDLRLRIRADAMDAAAIRPAAERMVRLALERCAAELEQRAPGRVVMLRNLPLHWRIDESVLEDAEQVDELAQAVADAIERASIPYTLDPAAAHEGAIVFDDEPHLRASRLLALARGRSAWFPDLLESEGEGDPLAALAVPERRATALATLIRLARDGVLAEVLAAQPAPAVAVLAAALGCAGSPPTPSRDAGAAAETDVPTRALASQTDALAGQLADVASRWPALSAPARTLALRVHAAAMLDAGVEAAESFALAAAAAPRRPPEAPPAPGFDAADVSRPGAIMMEKPPQALPAFSPDESAAPAREIESTRRLFEPNESSVPTTAELDEFAGFAATRCAGLFYLLDRIQELDLAESLWKACLPEGAVLAAAVTALLGPDFAGDAAPALFGGVEGPVACPDVTPEQHEEVAIATCAALAAALPRRNLAELPPVFLALADHPSGRLLVASAEGSPFAFFAWPASKPGQLKAGLRALADAWPYRGELAAAPSLAALDASGRLRPNPGSGPGRLFLPDAPSAPAAALLALVAGASCLLFAARVGAPSPDTVQAFVARHFLHPARIRLGAERIDVILSNDDIDFDARRAALDRDPGWIPWLRRIVRFVFEVREPAKDSTAGGELQ